MHRMLLPLALVLGLLPAGSAQTLDATQRRKAIEHYTKGEEALREERWEDAVEDFRKAVKLYPDFVLAHYGMGQARMALREYPAAVSAFSAARDAYYKFSAAKVNDRVAAAEVSQRMTDESRTLGGVDARGSAAKGMNERLNVLRDLEQVKRMDDGNLAPPAEISLSLAGAWFRQGNLEEAEKENRNALQARPEYGQAHNNLAVICMMTGRIAEAQAEVEKAEKSGLAVNPRLKEELAKRAEAGR